MQYFNLTFFCFVVSKPQTLTQIYINTGGYGYTGKRRFLKKNHFLNFNTNNEKILIYFFFHNITPYWWFRPSEIKSQINFRMCFLSVPWMVVACFKPESSSREFMPLDPREETARIWSTPLFCLEKKQVQTVPLPGGKSQIQDIFRG